MLRPILVVEDDDVVRDFVVTVLRGEGREVLTADSVDAARRTIFARPDADNLCLVMDIVLHHDSGIELAQELIKRYSNFCVLLISGFTDDVLVIEEEDATRMAFLAKPFTRKELLVALEKVCG